ncbi:hypothetical protein [Bradyrhizobium vignae]|uniref:hypothetical protein n=1 Tax=Bradyrhizobium vignae TaxID=1549949 RepID=UPI0011AE9C0B|nr:hypothetical protein [Bradyrhizobium vignae]
MLSDIGDCGSQKHLRCVEVELSDLGLCVAQQIKNAQELFLPFAIRNRLIIFESLGGHNVSVLEIAHSDGCLKIIARVVIDRAAAQRNNEI